MDYGTIISSAITAGGTLLGIWIQKKYSDKKKPDLSDKDYDDLLKPIIGLIFDEFKADRVNYMSFHNGEKTFDGYSLKNLSMMVEMNKEGNEDIIMEMQKIPAISFKRMITDLRSLKDEEFIVSFEAEKHDKLSNIFVGYGMKTAIFCRIKNRHKKNPWTGILTIGFNDLRKDLDLEKLNWLSLQIDRINEEISTMA